MGRPALVVTAAPAAAVRCLAGSRLTSEPFPFLSFSLPPPPPAPTPFLRAERRLCGWRKPDALGVRSGREKEKEEEKTRKGEGKERGLPGPPSQRETSVAAW